MTTIDSTTNNHEPQFRSWCVSKPRFTVLSDGELLVLEKKQRAKRTEKATQSGPNTLNKFCHETKLAIFDELKMIPESEPFLLSKRFLAGAQTKDGILYALC